MSVKALQDYIFTAKYACYKEDKKRRETWNEAVDRDEDMMMKKYADKPEVHEDIKWAYGQMRKKRVSGSQRALQFGGDPIFKHNVKMYNCAYAPIDKLSFFQKCMYCLLCGAGVGFSVQRCHINLLPKLNKPTKNKRTFVIQDSIEGWSDSIGVLLSSYFVDGTFPEYYGHDIDFNYSLIRKKGSKIGKTNGKSPGPEPLRKCHKLIRNILDNIVNSGRNFIKPIEAYDIVMHIADSSISGGIRRSATIALFSIDDEEMYNAKTGDWFYTNPQRGRSNNSAVLVRNKTTWEEFHKVFQSTKQYGEPGFYFTDDENMGVNPCCIPSCASLYTKTGIKKLSEVSIGDYIWSTEGWTKVLDKWKTGIKPLYKYVIDDRTSFVSTKDHQVVVSGKKMAVDDADYIDIFEYTELTPPDTGIAINTITHPQKIKYREYLGEQEVFDIMVDNESHTFYANGCNVSNCEISFYPYIEWNGKIESDFHFCNLSTINGKKIKSKEDLLQAVRAATIIGTLQAGFTDFPYLGPICETIVRKEALLGVSITGIMDAANILLDENIQKEGAELAKKVNKEIAEKININPAARITCLKPEGTTSCVFGTSSGIHPHHARRYFRRVQANTTENVYQFFKKRNELACEKSVWSNNNTDDIITFCVDVEKGAILKNDLPALKMLEIVKNTQINWVLTGTNIDRCIHEKCRHNVSNTINVKENEWDDVEKYIYNNREYFTGVSVIPFSGDKDYQQAPFCEVYTPEEIVENYGDASIFASGLIVDGLKVFDDNLWIACDAVLGIKNLEEVKPPEKIDETATFSEYSKFEKEYAEYEKYLGQLDWIRRAKQFANRYFNDDVRKMTYCLKDVKNWKHWCDLKREYKDVDYTEMVEEDDNTRPTDLIACSGGSCEIF